ncbi:MAG: cryptochrome/photolyase family protein [Halodesulfurarchaeum sp.]
MTDAGATLFWHRRDLRLGDNTGLAAAASSSPVVGVAVLDPAALRNAGTVRTGFYLASLAGLQQAYRSKGSDLVVRRGNPRTEVPALSAEFDAERVVWNRDYSSFAVERDESVAASLPESVSVETYSDLPLFEPGSILTSAGDHYSVFSYYYKKWAARDVPAVGEEPAAEKLESVSATSVPDVMASPVSALPLPAGRNAALDRLESFLAGPVYDYAEQREYPAQEGTARISQDLALGLLGVREIRRQIEVAEAAAETEAGAESVEAFRRQLAWRDFYIQVLDVHPETVSENFREYENPIEWRNDSDELAAWKAGRTGYPIVDAGMRQLHTEAYVHNRVRMIVASFLTKDLQIDWREGYRWFRAHLVDHNTANDVGGWQWAASTGTDAQPYFRIFNPMTQGERYDPEAEYIRTYVEELEAVPAELVHQWPDLDSARRTELAPEYPEPIVDHAKRREAALEMFERARGND